MSARQAEQAERHLRQRAKAALRNQMRALREAIPDSACDARTKSITSRVLELDPLKHAHTVLAFASIRKEVRTGPLIDALHAARKKVALPRVVDNDLVLHRMEPGDELATGAFSVPEPFSEAPMIDPAAVEFAVVPALAVDPRGYRIGYGAGYYDRLLPRLQDACTCVLVYDFQLIAEVPELPFDEPVDLIVTDARTIRTG